MPISAPMLYSVSCSAPFVAQLRACSGAAPAPPNPKEGKDGTAPAASSSAAAEEAPLSAEEAEVEKDRQALKYTVMGIITIISSICAVWYGTTIASRRYRGADESVLVGVESRGRPSLGGPFTLVSTDGEPMSQARFLGKWTFFYFGFVHCPEICPIELNRMTKVVTEVHKQRPDAAIAPLFVSCDPKRDSLMAIKEYLSVFHKDFIGLVGTPNQVAETCKSYRIYYSVPDQQAEDSGDYLIDHSIAIFLFDPQGRFVDFFGNRFSEGEITEKVLGYIDKYNADPRWTNY